MTNEKTLSNGIVIRDIRHLGCGIAIENQNTKYLKLIDVGLKNLYLNRETGFYIDEDTIDVFQKEFNEMTQALKEANEFLNREEK